MTESAEDGTVNKSALQMVSFIARLLAHLEILRRFFQGQPVFHCFGIVVSRHPPSIM